MPVNTYRTSVPSFGEGSTPNPLASRRAEQYNLPAPIGWAMEGRCFVASEGGVTTPITATNTGIVLLRPELVLRVPAGTTVIPLFTNVVIETITASVIHEIMWSSSQDDAGNGTSSAITNAPVNLLTVGGRATTCTVRQAYTGDTAANTNLAELYRKGVTTAAIITGVELLSYDWSPINSQTPAVLVGPASLMLHIASGTTAPTIFARIVWAEFLSTELGYA